uniref:HU domain-containing protein n=1 Tax=Pedobacter schmidteae TaxID=2201271 RepID=UPI000EAB81E9|nr:SPOR domain-containing protein [Pedobacter schmidteae]
MDILSYLTTLIKTHKEVGIPGLGTIYKRKSPGRYDVDTHSFLPPSYTLGFTSDLKEQVLLTDLISKKRNISVDAATYFVEQFAQHTLDELSTHQESDFGELGTFSTASGSLAFIPKQESNLGFDFYGLPTLKAAPDSNKFEIEEDKSTAQTEELTVDVPATQVTEAQLELENNNADLGDGTENIDAEDLPSDEILLSHLDSTELPFKEQKEENHPVQVEETEQINDEQPVYEEITEVIVPAEKTSSPVAPIIETEQRLNVPEEPATILEKVKPEDSGHFTLDYSDQKKSGIPLYLKIIIGIVGLAILTGVIYMAKPELFNGILKQPANTPVVKADTLLVKHHEQLIADSLARVDSIRRSNEKAIIAADSAKDSLAAKNVVPVQTKPVATPSESEISYEIIAASLLNQKEADNFLADMKRKGIPAKVADMPGRRVKISIGSFADEETAKKELEILKKTTKIPGIYIYKVRHTNNPK